MLRGVALALSLIVLGLLPGVVPAAAAADPEQVRTESGRIRCLVYANDYFHGGGPQVACQTSGPDNRGFLQAPVSESPGFHRNIAVVTASSAFKWDEGNIPGSREAMEFDIVLTYGRTIRLNGWTIQPSTDGTHFTNDLTDHGMFVSVENVYSF